MLARFAQSRTPAIKIIGGGCLGFGVLLLAALTFILPVWVQVNCLHSSPGGIGSGPTNCTLRGSNLIRIPWQTRQIENVVGAELNQPNYRPGWSHRTLLYTYEAEVPIASYSVRYSQAKQAKERLQGFLSFDLALDDADVETSPQPALPSQSLSFTYGPPWIPLLAASMFALAWAGSGALLLWLGLSA